MSGRRYSKTRKADEEEGVRGLEEARGGSPAARQPARRLSPAPSPAAPQDSGSPARQVSAKKRAKEAAVSTTAAGRSADGADGAGRSRVPQVGDVVECEMEEPEAPDGVEWLPGSVTWVDARTKKMKVLVQDNEEDEEYKFSEEGKEWRWPTFEQPSSTKATCGSSGARASSKRKSKAYELKEDSEDEDLFVPSRGANTPAGSGGKKPSKTASATAKKKPAFQSTSSTPSTAGSGPKGRASTASHKKAAASAKRGSTAKTGDGEGTDVNDSDDFAENKSQKRPAPAAEKAQPAKRKSMPKVAKTLMGIFAEDVLWDQEEEEARMQQEKAAQEQDASSAKQERSWQEELGISQTQQSAACTDVGAVQKRNRAQELEEKGKWMHGICGQRKRRKAKSISDDDSSDSDADDLTEGKKMLETVYFPAKMFFQDGLDKIMMEQKLGRATLDEKEKGKIIRIVDQMKVAKEYTKYFA